MAMGRVECSIHFAPTQQFLSNAKLTLVVTISKVSDEDTKGIACPQVEGLMRGYMLKWIKGGRALVIGSEVT